MDCFLGRVEENANHDDAMSRWVKGWMAAGRKKAAFEAGRDAFSYLASKEDPSEEDPVAADDDGTLLVFWGFIARDQFGGSGDAEPSTDAGLARRLLDRHREEGPDALVGLNGRYLVCVWEPHEKRLCLMNDALGLKPVFLWSTDRTFAFSSNVWPLACHPNFDKRMDRRSIADLLLLSHQQGNRTLFADVSVLPPGSVTTWRNGELVSRTVRTLQFSEDRWDWSIDRAADEMHAQLVDSVRRRVSRVEELLLPLSGGFDSRVLLGLLSEQPATIHAVTQYQHGLFGRDAQYAKQIAAAVGVRLKSVPFSDDVFTKYRRRCVAINGGMYDVHTGRFLSLVEQSGRVDLPVVSAHLGGEMTSRFQISDTRFSTPQEHFKLAFGGVNMYRFSPDDARELLGGTTQSEHVDESLNDCEQFFLSYQGPAFQRYYNWDLLLSRRRYIAYQLLYYEQSAPVIAPFYDREFIDFMCSLPFAVIQDQQAYLAMMRRHLPQLARLPNTNTDLPVLLSTGAVIRDFFNSQYKRFVQRPLARVLKSRRWIGHPAAQYGFALMGASRDVLDHIIRSKEMLATYLKPEAVQNAVDRQLAGDHSASMGLLGLSTLATALDMLEDPSAVLDVWSASGQEHQ